MDIPICARFDTRMRMLLACVLSMALLPGRVATAQPLDDVLALIPGDAEAFAAIGRLRDGSNQFQQALEGMDRTDALFGGRPIDQAKSTLALNVGVDDLAGAAVFLLRHDERFVPIWIVPVTDGEDFLKGNFVARDNDAPCEAVTFHEHRYFGSLAGRIVGRFVLISPDADALCEYDTGKSMTERMHALTKGRLHTLVSHGDPLLFVSRTAALDLVPLLTEEWGNHNNLPVSTESVRGMIERSPVENILLIVDFDPLALFVRSIVTLDPDSELRQTLAAAEPGQDNLRRLPDRPFFLAFSAHVQSLGGRAALDVIEQMTGLERLPSLLRDLDATHLACFAEDAGAGGGLLRRGSLLLTTNNAEGARDAFRAGVENGTFGRESAWDGRQQHDDIGEVHTFTVRPDTSTVPLLDILKAPLLGGPSWSGAAIASDDALILTTTRSRALIRDAFDRVGGAERALSGNAVVRSMRGFLPASPQLELYIDASRASALFRPLIEIWSNATGARVRPIPSGLPPIAWGVSVHDDGYEHGAIIPAGLLAIAMDQIVDQLMRQRFFPANAAEEQPEEVRP